MTSQIDLQAAADTMSSRRLSKNHRWLHENEHAFAGQWVALRDGKLIAANVKLRAVQRKVKPGTAMFIRCKGI